MVPTGVPQPFNSASLVRAVDPNVTRLLLACKRRSIGGRHNLARVGRLRRPVVLINPVQYFALAREISIAWKEISSHLASAKLSITRPVQRPGTQRALEARVIHPDRPVVRAHHRTRGRFLLEADVQRCYPSIYTHSIPWALHTKAVAKSDRTPSLLGNRLDKLAQQAQDGQTRGLPIGPDTSFVLSEIVMTGVDQLLEARLGRLDGFRAVDDFELVFESRSGAEKALAVLNEALAAFELEINEQKTRVVELPQTIDDTWPINLRNFPFRRPSNVRPNELSAYFSLAVELAQQNPRETVLGYAISRAQSLTISQAAWPLYQSLLLQCALAEPGTLRFVLSELKRYQNLGHEVDRKAVATTLTQVIERHVPLAQGSEVAWALWSHISLAVPVEKSAADIVPMIDDPFVPILALHARHRKLIPTGLDLASYKTALTPDGLYGPQWLLSYEATVKGWLKPRSDHIAKDPCFNALRQLGTTFYNTRASALLIRKWRSRLGFAGLKRYDFGAT